MMKPIDWVLLAAIAAMLALAFRMARGRSKKGGCGCGGCDCGCGSPDCHAGKNRKN